MSLIEFLRIIYRHWVLLIATAFLLSGMIFWTTRNEKQQFTSTTLINTGLVSGYTIEKSQSGKVDYAYTQNEFANLISLATANNTLLELSVTLFTKCLLLEEPDLYLISSESWNEATKDIPEQMLQGVTVPGSFEATYKNIWHLLDATEVHPISELIIGGNTLFGLEHLNTIKVAREGSSDMIRMTYTTTDPGICRETLATLTEIFIRKHREVKEGQTQDVLAFFEESTQRSALRLRNAEDELLRFRVENKIINYYEQTRFISAKKEDLDAQYHSERMEIASADTAIRRLENQLASRTHLPDLHQSIAKIRDSLATLSAQIEREELFRTFTLPKTDSIAPSSLETDLTYLPVDSFSIYDPMLASLSDPVLNLNTTSDTIDPATYLSETLSLQLPNVHLNPTPLPVKLKEPSFTDTELVQMKKRAQQLRNRMIHAAQHTYHVNNTPEGIPSEELLTQWLQSILRYEEARIRLKIIRNRQEEFQEIYSQFAPWGSRLKRIEREIDVSEREYLANLHSYNQALLHQKNMLMATNLKVMDAPFYPSKPAASKRVMFIGVGFVAGIILPLAVLLASEFLDNTLRKPSRSSKQTSLNLSGGMPKIPSNARKWKGIRFDEVQERCLKQLFLDIQLEMIPFTDRPQVVAFTSTREKEGKTFLIDQLAQRLRGLGEKVMVIFPKNTSHVYITDHDDNYFYDIKDNLEVMKNLAELLPACGYYEESAAQYDWLLLEVPGILANSFPLNILQGAHLTIMVARANKVWNHGDQKALDLLKKGTNRQPKILINATRPDVLEELIGEIPKKRSWLRVLVKKLAVFGLSERKKI